MDVESEKGVRRNVVPLFAVWALGSFDECMEGFEAASIAVTSF